MARSFLILFLMTSFAANAQIFGFGGTNRFASKVPEIAEKLRKMEVKPSPEFEDNFNRAVREIQNVVEEEKLFCAGEASDSEGKTLGKEQKELCFRELKKHYLQSMEVVFELKKKYLVILHKDHVERLTEMHKKLSADIEKSF